MIGWQLVINGVGAAGSYLLVALGFAIIYRLLRFIHFSHAFVFIAGPYYTLFLRQQIGSPVFIAIPSAILLCAFTGCLIEVVIYKPLRRKKASNLVLFLSSLGIYIILQNCLALVFGNDPITLRTATVQEGINVLGAKISLIQISTIIAGVSGFIIVAMLFYWTRIGTAARAVANDMTLAHISGINSDRIILLVFFIGSALAGVAGVLTGYDIGMTPTMGITALMMGAIVTIVGGVVRIIGVGLGALLIGLAQHLGTWKLNAEWQDVIAFVILLIFLLFRPQGFLGKKIKKTSI